MKRTATDLLILIVIAAPVSAMMLFPPGENLRIERHWGAVIYTPPVTRGQATALADVMVDQGVFAGSPISLKLSRDGENWTLMMAMRHDYEKQISRETIAALGFELCSVAFPGKTASFRLMDSDLESFEEILPPTLFPAF